MTTLICARCRAVIGSKPQSWPVNQETEVGGLCLKCAKEVHAETNDYLAQLAKEQTLENSLDAFRELELDGTINNHHRLILTRLKLHGPLNSRQLCAYVPGAWKRMPQRC